MLRHTETPLVRTAPVPLFLLAEQVRANDLTVVITGEGADELFWGYDLFKEVVVRELNQRDPERAQALLEELYPYLGGGGARRGPAFTRFLLETGSPDDPLGSHLTRAAATATVKAFYRPEVAAEIGEGASLDRLRGELPPAFDRWSTLERAAWLEVATLLEPYLLAAQGDRVAMAHGVEGRFPFLDHRVFAHSAGPAAGAQARRAARQGRAARARRRPAPGGDRRAPQAALPGARGGSRSSAPDAPEWVEESLSPAALAETAIWDARPSRGPGAALPRRPGDRHARGDGPGRHPLHPALARGLLRARAPTPTRPRPLSRV